jgi:anti-sigma regulatory factor (Ser/Thr protein kinase)
MPPSTRVSIGADRNEIARVNAAFDDFADAHALPDAVRRSVSVVLDELLTNTLSYGLAEPGGEVIVDIELHADRLVITISDNGRPFDPLSIPAPDTTLSVEDREIGGQGIHLVRRMVDELRYHRRSGRNIVMLTKRLGGGAAAGHSERDTGGGRGDGDHDA